MRVAVAATLVMIAMLSAAKAQTVSDYQGDNNRYSMDNFLLGFYSGFIANSMVNDDHSFRDQVKRCFPSSITSNALGDAMRAYIYQHPEKLMLPLSSVFIGYMSEACKGK